MMFDMVAETTIRMAKMIMCAVVAWSLMTFATIRGASAELVVVKDGKSQAPVVLFADAPPTTRQAAEDLITYIEKVSGAKPELIDGEPEPVPERAIWVGYQPILEEFLPELSFEFEHPEQILIAANSHHLVIAGRDRWDPDHMVGRAWERNLPVEDFQREYGTAYAVYTFIQDHLDVRWLWPGELGEDIIERDTLTFEPFEHHYYPPFRQREVFANPGDRTQRRWLRFQRSLLGSFQMSLGHAFTEWWDRYYEKHPDYFALQPDGTRSGFPSARHAKLCQSNPAVWDQWLTDVEQQLEKNPMQVLFNAAPNDGSSAGICICEDCRAWDHPNGERRLLRWEGHAQEYVAMTDRYITFTNQLAEKLRRRYPERELLVSQLAYGPSKPAPVDAVPGENVVIGYVGHFPTTSEAERQREKAEIRQWGAVAATIAYRPNMYWYSGGWHGLPTLTVRKAAEDLRFLADHNVMALIFDHSPHHWATLGPQHYILTQLAWDPYQDAEALMNDYYQRGFGPAADEVRAYFDLMEEAHDEIVERPGFATSMGARTRVVSFILDAYGDETRLEQAQSLLDAAREKLVDERDIYHQRLAFVQTGLDFTRVHTQAIATMQDVRESDGKDAEAVRRALELAEQREELLDAHDGRAFSAHHYHITWVRARRMQDYVGPPSEAFQRAAGLLEE